MSKIVLLSNICHVMDEKYKNINFWNYSVQLYLVALIYIYESYYIGWTDGSWINNILKI